MFIVFEDAVSLDGIYTAALKAADIDEVYVLAHKNNKAIIEKDNLFNSNVNFIFCEKKNIDPILFCLRLSVGNEKSRCFLVNVMGDISELMTLVPKLKTTETVLDISDELNKFVSSIRDSDHIDINLKSKLIYFSSLTNKIKNKELDLLLGKSGKRKSLLCNKSDATSIELLGIDEFTALDKYYNELLVEYGEDASLYLTDKSDNLKKYFKNSINKKGGCIKVSSFPVAYKYFSVFLFISAHEVMKTRNYTASYILFFRAFEVYCEGVLLSQGKAKIDTYIDDYDNVFNDCFILSHKGNNIKPMGFGIKWRVIRESKFTNTMPVKLVRDINVHKKLRNVSALSHGDLVSSLEILIELRTTVIDAISYFENKFCQNVFLWDNVNNDMQKHFVYDFRKYVSAMALNKYNYSNVKL